MNTLNFQINIAGFGIQVYNIPFYKFIEKIGTYYEPFIGWKEALNLISLITYKSIKLSNKWEYSFYHKEKISIIEGRGIQGKYNPLQKKGELFYEPHAISSMDAFFRFIINLESAKQKLLMIHSSGIIVNDGAYLFIGQPGSGKSTIAMLQQCYGVLSDELNILEITNDYLIVHGTPFISSIESCIPGPVKLKAISILKKANYNKVKLIDFSRGISELINSIVDYSPGNTVKKIFLERYISLLSKILFIETTFKKSGDIWKKIEQFDRQMFG